MLLSAAVALCNFHVNFVDYRWQANLFNFEAIWPASLQVSCIDGLGGGIRWKHSTKTKLSAFNQLQNEIPLITHTSSTE